VTYGNGVITTYSYDRERRPTRIKTTLGSTTLLDLNYTYDAVGNVLGIDTESYSYDQLDRLVSSAGPWGSLAYAYDGVGNRLWSTAGGTNTTYTYGQYNRLLSAGTSTYTYDNAGALKTQTQGSTTTAYTYDTDKRLTRVSQGSSTLGSYAYTAQDQRIVKVEGSVTTVFDSQGANVLWEDRMDTHSQSDYVYAAGLTLAKISGATIYYFHQDKQGSVRLVTLGASTNFSTNYQPFGAQNGTSGIDPIYKYTGKPQDATGLYYYGARYYDSSTGRFISRDPAHAQLRDSQTLCQYSYARNDPERYTDSTGACLDAWGLAEDVVGFFADILGFWFLEDEDPSGVIQIYQQFVTDWAPSALQDLGPPINYAGLVTDVVGPAALSIGQALIDDAIRVNFLTGIASLGITLSDLVIEASDIVLASVWLAGNIFWQFTIQQPPGICINFFEAPPVGKLPWFGGGTLGWYVGRIYHVFNDRYDFRRDMGLPQKGLPTAI